MALSTETQAQEIIDHFVMKLRMVKFARIQSYSRLFSGDPVWATLAIAGLGVDGRSMVTKNDYRSCAWRLWDYGSGTEHDCSVFQEPARVLP